jgi:hypothetical protein
VADPRLALLGSIEIGGRDPRNVTSEAVADVAAPVALQIGRFRQLEREQHGEPVAQLLFICLRPDA